MIKLSKMTDYAVVILADMAMREGQLVSAAGIAESTKLPEPTVSKILKLLSKQKIIVATRGMNGGYTLQHDPADISMARVITATDGPIALTACVEQSNNCCERENTCAIKGQWNPVNMAMQNALESVSLSQMIGGR